MFRKITKRLFGRKVRNIKPRIENKNINESRTTDFFPLENEINESVTDKIEFKIGEKLDKAEDLSSTREYENKIFDNDTEFDEKTKQKQFRKISSVKSSNELILDESYMLYRDSRYFTRNYCNLDEVASLIFQLKKVFIFGDFNNDIVVKIYSENSSIILNMEKVLIEREDSHKCLSLNIEPENTTPLIKNNDYKGNREYIDRKTDSKESVNSLTEEELYKNSDEYKESAISEKKEISSMSNIQSQEFSTSSIKNLEAQTQFNIQKRKSIQIENIKMSKLNKITKPNKLTRIGRIVKQKCAKEVTSFIVSTVSSCNNFSYFDMEFCESLWKDKLNRNVTENQSFYKNREEYLNNCSNDLYFENPCNMRNRSNGNRFLNVNNEDRIYKKNLEILNSEVCNDNKKFHSAFNQITEEKETKDQFNQGFLFRIPIYEINSSLFVEVYEGKKVSSNKCLGQIRIPIKTLIKNILAEPSTENGEMFTNFESVEGLFGNLKKKGKDIVHLMFPKTFGETDLNTEMQNMKNLCRKTATVKKRSKSNMFVINEQNLIEDASSFSSTLYPRGRKKNETDYDTCGGDGYVVSEEGDGIVIESEVDGINELNKRFKLGFHLQSVNRDKKKNGSLKEVTIKRLRKHQQMSRDRRRKMKGYPHLDSSDVDNNLKDCNEKFLSERQTIVLVDEKDNRGLASFKMCLEPKYPLYKALFAKVPFKTQQTNLSQMMIQTNLERLKVFKLHSDLVAFYLSVKSWENPLFSLVFVSLYTCIMFFVKIHQVPLILMFILVAYGLFVVFNRKRSKIENSKIPEFLVKGSSNEEGVLSLNSESDNETNYENRDSFVERFISSFDVKSKYQNTEYIDSVSKINSNERNYIDNRNINPSFKLEEEEENIHLPLRGDGGLFSLNTENCDDQCQNRIKNKKTEYSKFVDNEPSRNNNFSDRNEKKVKSSNKGFISSYISKFQKAKEVASHWNEFAMTLVSIFEKVVNILNWKDKNMSFMFYFLSSFFLLVSSVVLYYVPLHVLVYFSTIRYFFPEKKLLASQVYRLKKKKYWYQLFNVSILFREAFLNFWNRIPDQYEFFKDVISHKYKIL